ncbi:MAG TPA: hypothetical protein PLP27_09940, partial [Crocinitomicaceae bacterium]|nr:hypothetical protein [Crocinitomicaceae bacterium]
MKKAIYFVVLTTISSFTYSQSLQSAKLKTASERYDEATNEYLSLIKNDPQNLNNYFFLAENYLLSEKTDSAAYYWEKASTLDE